MTEKGSDYREGILLDLGMTDYREAWEIQKRLWAKRVEGRIPDTLILLEHPHTITLGKRGNTSHLKASPEYFEKLKIPVIHVERGGDVTYHGPGQAVTYPIIHLSQNKLGASEYVSRLEEIIIHVLKDFGIEGTRNPLNRGVWWGDNKIASIGIAIRKWVTYHGVALNYQTNLDYFQWINACGLENVHTTSMARILGKDIPKADLYASLRFHFKNLFRIDWRERKLSDIPEG